MTLEHAEKYTHTHDKNTVYYRSAKICSKGKWVPYDAVEWLVSNVWMNLYTKSAYTTVLKNYNLIVNGAKERLLKESL